MKLETLAEQWEDQINRETKDYLVTQINDWALGAWNVCLRLGLYEDADRFIHVTTAAKYRIKEINDAEQDTDTLMGR